MTIPYQGHVEDATGDLVSVGYSVAKARAGHSIRTDMPNPAVVRNPGATGQFDHWTGAIWDKKNHPPGVVLFAMPVPLMCQQASFATNSLTYLESGIEVVLDMDAINPEGVYELKGVLTATITADKVDTTALVDLTEDVGGAVAGSEVSEETIVYTKKTSAEFALPESGLREYQIRLKRQGGAGQPDALVRAAVLQIIGRKN